MQPIPAKTRTALVVGAALLAVIVGGVAVWSARRGTEPLPLEVEEPSITAAPLSPLDYSATPAPTSPAPSATSNGSATPSATTAPVAPAAAVPATHVVVDGETLSSISRSYYGTNIYAGDIEALNELEDPNLIHTGQMLQLPKVEDLHKS